MYGWQGFFSKIVLIVRILKKYTDFLENVRIFSKKMYGLYGFFQKNLATL